MIKATMKSKQSLKFLMLCFLIFLFALLVSCKGDKIKYAAIDSAYTYNEYSQYYITRTLYKENPICLYEGSALSYYYRGYYSNPENKRNQNFSEYIVVQTTLQSSKGDSWTPGIKISKDKLAPLILAAKSINEPDPQIRQLKEALLLVIIDASLDWEVNPAQKILEATIGTDYADFTDKDVKWLGERRIYPFCLEVTYDLLNNELKTDFCISHIGKQPINVQQINIATEKTRFSIPTKDLTKRNVPQKSRSSIESFVVESYTTPKEALSEGILAQMGRGWTDLYVEFIGSEGSSSGEKHGIDAKLEADSFDELTAIYRTHEATTQNPDDFLYVIATWWSPIY